MDELADLDDVAYIRFASIYREFKDMSSFMKTMEDMMAKRERVIRNVWDIWSQAPLLCSQSRYAFPEDEQILIKLYQPLVGAIAVALYQTLISNYDPYGIVSDSKGIYSLQEQLDCSLKTMFTSLHKLEAVGLVQTFLSDNVFNNVIVFKLLKVPSADKFLRRRY